MSEFRVRTERTIGPGLFLEVERVLRAALHDDELSAYAPDETIAILPTKGLDPLDHLSKMAVARDSRLASAYSDNAFMDWGQTRHGVVTTSDDGFWYFCADWCRGHFRMDAKEYWAHRRVVHGEET